jgi:SAM-dependent methyltransferase
MSIDDIQRNWDEFGRTDPLWAVLTDPEKQGNKWKPEEFYATGRERVASLMEKLDSYGIPFERRDALDFGSGAGRLSQALTQYFDTVTGVDIAPSMVEFARLNNPHGERLRFVHNPRPDLSVFPDASFDFILSLITLQHTTPELIEKYLAEFGRVLRPGGLLAFELPDEQPPGIPFKIRLRNATPRPILEAYHRIRYGKPLPFYKPGGSGPQMNLCGLPPEKTRQILTASGMAIRKVETPQSKDRLESYFYIAVKQ